MSITTDQLAATASAITALASSAPAAIKAAVDDYITATQAEIDALTATKAAIEAALSRHTVALANATAFDPAYVAPVAAPVPVAVAG